MKQREVVCVQLGDLELSLCPTNCTEIYCRLCGLFRRDDKGRMSHCSSGDLVCLEFPPRITFSYRVSNKLELLLSSIPVLPIPKKHDVAAIIIIADDICPDSLLDDFEAFFLGHYNSMAKTCIDWRRKQDQEACSTDMVIPQIQRS